MAVRPRSPIYVRLDGRWKFKTVRFVTVVQAQYEKGGGILVGRG